MRKDRIQHWAARFFKHDIMKNFLVIVYSWGGGGGIHILYDFHIISNLKGPFIIFELFLKDFLVFFQEQNLWEKVLLYNYNSTSTINYILLSRAVNVESTEESVLMYNYTCTVQVQLIIYYSLEQWMVSLLKKVY